MRSCCHWEDRAKIELELGIVICDMPEDVVASACGIDDAPGSPKVAVLKTWDCKRAYWRFRSSAPR